MGMGRSGCRSGAGAQQVRRSGLQRCRGDLVDRRTDRLDLGASFGRKLAETNEQNDVADESSVDGDVTGNPCATEGEREQQRDERSACQCEQHVAATLTSSGGGRRNRSTTLTGAFPCGLNRALIAARRIERGLVNGEWVQGDDVRGSTDRALHGGAHRRNGRAAHGMGHRRANGGASVLQRSEALGGVHDRKRTALRCPEGPSRCAAIFQVRRDQNYGPQSDENDKNHVRQLRSEDFQEDMVALGA